MADATELQTASVTKITDANETEIVGIRLRNDGKNALCIDDEVITAGVNAKITVGTSAVEAKVGANRLVGRRLLSIMPTSAPIWYGFNSNVTTSTGRKLFKDQVLTISIGDCPLYTVGQSSTEVDVLEAK